MLDLFESVDATRFSLTRRTMDEEIARIRKHWSTPYIRRQLPNCSPKPRATGSTCSSGPTPPTRSSCWTPERAGELTGSAVDNLT